MNNFKWSHKTAVGVISMEGNDDYLWDFSNLELSAPPAPTSKTDLKAISEIRCWERNLFNSLRFANWIELAVELTLTEPDGNVVEGDLTPLERLWTHKIPIAEMQLEHCFPSGFCTDMNPFAEDDDEWLRKQLTRLRLKASTNIQISKVLLREELNKVYKEKYPNVFAN